MKIDGDDVLFQSTGKKAYANGGIIGIDPDLITCGGYDDNFPYCDKLSQEEKIELADYMIAVWTRYKHEAKA